MRSRWNATRRASGTRRRLRAIPACTDDDRRAGARRSVRPRNEDRSSPVLSSSVLPEETQLRLRVNRSSHVETRNSADYRGSDCTGRPFYCLARPGTVAQSGPARITRPGRQPGRGRSQRRGFEFRLNYLMTECRSAAGSRAGLPIETFNSLARDAIALCERRRAAAIRVTGAPLVAISRKRRSSASVQYLFRRLYIGGLTAAK
jgi:hypothetical protein